MKLLIAALNYFIGLLFLFLAINAPDGNIFYIPAVLWIVAGTVWIFNYITLGDWH